MYDYLKEFTKDKNVCILGFGMEGKSTFKALSEHCKCKSITVCDKKEIDGSEFSCDFVCGEDYQKNLDNYDIVFKSPGIVLEKDINDYKSTITSEMEVFTKIYANQIIGITGTKGKSTTSSLIFHIINSVNENSLFAGNIGIPVFDIVPKINNDTIIVCEMSCHQLEYMTCSPHISVFLNVFEEHLDHYKTMERYTSAKKNIYLHQNKNDILICNKNLLPQENNIENKIITVSDNDENSDIFICDGIVKSKSGFYVIPVEKISLLGKHNHYNIGIAHTVCKIVGISEKDFTNALVSFKTLHHRLEYIGEKDGIKFFDDSISTASETAIEAIKSVPLLSTIIIGGMDRGIDYSNLIDFLSKNDIENIILMEHSGKRIYDEISKKDDFRKKERIIFAEHLNDAVNIAKRVTPKGRSCVLSPAAASYGIFKNFEERGNAFKELVFGNF